MYEKKLTVAEKRIIKAQKRKSFWNKFFLFFTFVIVLFLGFEFMESKNINLKIWGTEKGIIIKTEENNIITFGEITISDLKIFEGTFMSYFDAPVDVTALEDLKENQQIKAQDFRIIKLTENLFMGHIKDLKFYFIKKGFKAFPLNLPVKIESDFWVLENYNASALQIPLPRESIFVLSTRKPTKKFLEKITEKNTPIINASKNWYLDFQKDLKFMVEK